MLRKLLFGATLLFSLNSFAGWDFFQTYIILDSGDGNFYHAGGFNSDGATTFNGRDYGYFNTSDTFILNGGEMKTFKNGGDDVCGGEIYYRIYKECETPPATFSSVSFGFGADLGGGDQRWETTNANVNILSGLSKGDYVLEVFWRVFGNDNGATACSQEKFDSNFTNNFTATFSVGTDGFSDGDFTASPVWSGDTADYGIVEASTLSGDGSNANIGSGTNENRDVLLSNASTGEAAITTPSTQAYGVWEFAVATGLNWDTSDSNNFGIILTSDTDDASKLKIGASMDFNGYYIKFKNGTAQDKFVLVRQDGTTETEILDLNYPLTPNAYDGYTLRVVRSTSGEWEVYADQGFDNTDASTLRGTIRDNNITTSSYFGVSTNISNPGAQRRLYFDNLLISPATELSFNTTSATVVETDGALTYDITIDIDDEDDRCATSADLVLISGDATRISNYTTQNLSWTANDGMSQTVTLTISTNDVCEEDETLVFELQNISGGCNAVEGADNRFTLSLEDDESGTDIEISDDFEDNDITDWILGGTWVAQNSAATINGTYDLKHDNSGAVNDYASLSLDNLPMRGVETRWRFNLKHGGFGTSANNWVMAVLAGNESDAWSATLDGYAIGVNFNGTADEMKLVRIDDGAYTDLITSSLVLSTNDIYGIEVIRDENGVWSFGYQLGGGWDSLTDAGSTATDNLYVVADYFSFAVELTSTNAGKPRIDDLEVRQYGCDETWYTVSTGNADGAIWSEDPMGMSGQTVEFGRFKRLEVQSGHTLTLNQDVIARDFAITGTMDAGSQELTVYGNFVNDGTLNSQTGTITFKGDDAQTILGSSTSTFNNLKIDNDGSTVTASGDLEVKGVLSPNEGTLDLNGNDLTLLSDASGTASIGAFAMGADVLGDVTMQRYIPAGDQDWVNLGVPLTGLDITDWNDDFVTTGFTGSDFDTYPFNNIQKYDETQTGDLNTGWTETGSTADALSNDQGYMVYLLATAQTVDAKGGVQKGSMNQPVSFTAADGATIDGWNLVNNKYPSAIDWDALVALSTNVSTYYVYDSETNTYLSRNGNTGIGSAPQYIASGQSFWVKADAAGASLQWEESIKADVATNFERTESALASIELTLSGSEDLDHAFIGFADGAQAAYENSVDAMKLTSISGVTPAIGTISPEDYLLEQNTVDMTEAQSFPIRFLGMGGGEMTFAVANLNNLPSSVCLTIEDTFNGETSAVEEGMTWTVNLNEAEVQDRFILHMTAPAQTEAANVSCYGLNDGTATITAPEGTFQLNWYDEMDQLISTTPEFSGTSMIEGLAFGNYTAELVSNNALCPVLSEVVYVDTPAEENTLMNAEAASCNLEGEGWIEVISSADNMSVSISTEWGENVFNEATNGNFILDELDAQIYEVNVETACGSWNESLDLRDPQAVSISVETPENTPVINGIGLIEIDADVEGDAVVTWFSGANEIGNGTTLTYPIDASGIYAFDVVASNDNCSASTQVIAIAEEAVGVTELDSAYELTFNGSALGVQLPGLTGLVQCEIFDASGKLVESFNIEAQSSVQWLVMTDLSKGMYTAVVTQEKQVVTSAKFVR